MVKLGITLNWGIFGVGNHDGDRLRHFVRIAHGHFPFHYFSLPLLVSPNRIRHRTYLGENKLKSRLESDSESESNGLLVKLLRGL